METKTYTREKHADVVQNKKNAPSITERLAHQAFTELERSVYACLETYSNVHRGSGHNSQVTTHLFERARTIVLEYMNLDKNSHSAIFCTPRSVHLLKDLLKPDQYKSISSSDFGLPLGVEVVAVDNRYLPKGTPFQTGGGTARLVSTKWVIWARKTDRYEAGTPAIVNCIAFAKGLLLVKHYGANVFKNALRKEVPATDLLYRDSLEQYTGTELLAQLRKYHIGRNMLVPTAEGPKSFVNLDNGASTPTFSPIFDTVRQTWQQTEQIQKDIIQESRAICAQFLGAPLAAYDVLFTANTTEALNIAAENIHCKIEHDVEPIVVNTIVEHNSNELPWRVTSHNETIRLSIDSEGFYDLAEMETVFQEYNGTCIHGKKRIALLSVSGASNVLGIYNDLTAICSLAHKYGVQVLVDAAQLVAHRKIDMLESGIDFLAFSAHKVYAPFGSGVLVARKGLLNFCASALEQIQTAGEKNVTGIAALAKALVLLERIGMETIQKDEQKLTKKLLQGLNTIPGVELYGLKDPESPRFAQKGGVVLFGMRSMQPKTIAGELSLRGGIGVRYGCHCAHLVIKQLLNIGPVLSQVQGLFVSLFPALQLPGLVRLSLGLENTEQDVASCISEFTAIVNDRAGKHNTVDKKCLNTQMNVFLQNASGKVYSHA